ncbi:MAG: acetyl-CoA carboxylase biotin carboxyl carrier protein [Bryobacterales bacterium]|nr:acetyl-CoA carboxylase biotin carboxyl carrier protein [Bryobacterales bacterium]
MTLEEIRELIKVVTETAIAELEVQRGDNRVRIRRVAENRTPEVIYAAPAGVAPASIPTPPPTAPAPASSPASRAGEATPEKAAEGLLDPNLTLVKSPIVGTFYEAPAPGAQPFVQVGDTVQPGKVLCIIESMKLMNEIEAEVAGLIVSKLVVNGQAVEYGEALFAIKPL